MPAECMQRRHSERECLHSADPLNGPVHSLAEPRGSPRVAVRRTGRPHRQMRRVHGHHRGADGLGLLQRGHMPGDTQRRGVLLGHPRGWTRRSPRRSPRSARMPGPRFATRRSSWMTSDLGPSGCSASHWEGFKQLVARCVPWRGRAVFGLEVSRLASSNAGNPARLRPGVAARHHPTRQPARHPEGTPPLGPSARPPEPVPSQPAAQDRQPAHSISTYFSTVLEAIAGRLRLSAGGSCRSAGPSAARKGQMMEETKWSAGLSSARTARLAIWLRTHPSRFPGWSVISCGPNVARSLSVVSGYSREPCSSRAGRPR